MGKANAEDIVIYSLIETSRLKELMMYTVLYGYNYIVATARKVWLDINMLMQWVTFRWKS